MIGGFAGWWRNLGLVPRFVLAGGIVMLVAMLVVGSWIRGRIERSVIDNTAAATALYMESFVSPLSQELADSDELSEPAIRALDEMMTGTPLGKRVVSFKLWKPGGLVVYASDPSIVGKTFAPTDGLRRAWEGEVAARFEGLGEEENAAEAALGLPLLEIYSPVRRVWSGDVIAVVEFYEVQNSLAGDLAAARRQSWMIVAAVFALCGLSLIGIVRAGGRTIEQQRVRLQAEVAHSREVAHQNAELRQRAVSAAARAAAQTERTLRQVGADLHDGPAQYLGLAALRLERALPATGEGQAEAEAIRGALTSALAEIRGISRGLALPDLDRLTLAEAVHRAVEAHPRPGIPIAWTGPADPGLGPSARICVYRFLQETLSNAARHAPDAPVEVAVAVGDTVTVTVRDRGPGFDPTSIAVRPDGGQGLAGLRDRAESIGGEIDIDSSGAGTTLRLRLPLEGGTT
jgi:signal transduction histidine kinase